MWQPSSAFSYTWTFLSARNSLTNATSNYRPWSELCRNIKAYSNESAFNRSVEEVAVIARTLLDWLETNVEPRDR